MARSAGLAGLGDEVGTVWTMAANGAVPATTTGEVGWVGVWPGSGAAMVWATFGQVCGARGRSVRVGEGQAEQSLGRFGVVAAGAEQHK